jgi:hypothetical protein
MRGARLKHGKGKSDYSVQESTKDKAKTKSEPCVGKLTGFFLSTFRWRFLARVPLLSRSLSLSSLSNTPHSIAPTPQITPPPLSPINPPPQPPPLLLSSIHHSNITLHRRSMRVTLSSFRIWYWNCLVTSRRLFFKFCFMVLGLCFVWS